MTVTFFLNSTVLGQEDCPYKWDRFFMELVRLAPSEV